MNQYYKPMLARQIEKAFTSEDWIFEVKWDGIRAISYVTDDLSIRTRNGLEIEQNFPEFQELKDLTKDAVVDGEILVMKQGKPDFQALAERSKTTSIENIKYLSRTLPATYVLFDLLEKDGKSLLKMPLIQRKELLQQAVKEGKRVIISAYVEDQGEIYYRAALSKSLEGIMAKKKDSQYEPGARTGNWLKIKPLLTCDCIIFGYTIGKGFREHTFGALILGLFDKDGPVYIGKVGTGFGQDTIESMLKTFKPLKVEHATLKNVNVPEEIVWLKPEIVCEIAFQNVTNDNKLRMPRFLGLRTDKAPSECTMDQILHDNLETYAAKRDFKGTSEPAPSLGLAGVEGKAFVVQEHHARRLHYDLRLEKDGVLKSWAAPKGIPEQSGDKRLAVETEDHPLEYKSFEGTIPEGHYGAGTVKIFDSGTYEVKTWNDKLVEFTLHGQTLQGRYALARFKKAGEKQWLLLKTKESDQ
jgi:DNA ligase D-like protein (predicted ligase)/DNA ligase D-like protein (predicted 3'-phosphoesterase)